MIRLRHHRPGASFIRDESGQVLPWLALLMVLFMGVGGLCIDLGRAYICQRELQASTDAAALAGGTALAATNATTTTVTTAAKAYSSVSPGANVNAALPSAAFAINFKCLSTLAAQNILCSSSATGYNAVRVTQTTTINTVFIRVLNLFSSGPLTSLTISATSTAAIKGTGAQYNVALLIDTTRSMTSNDSDASCNSTRIACALSGTQTLLQSLTPCTAASTSTSCTGFDNVSVFTFPAVMATTASNDYTCPASGKGSQSDPTIEPYIAPAAGANWQAPTGSSTTYQIVGFSHDFSSTNKQGGALATTSNLAITSGASGKSNCPGMRAVGGQGTYFAGAIYAALSALNAEQALNPGSLNALVILSDGDASAGVSNFDSHVTLLSNGNYPSATNQCHQAITAAQSASSTTTVYTIAYGAASSGCSTDSPSISPCATLLRMATAANDFYSDATASQNSGQCTSASNPSLTLNQIFQNIGSSLQNSRLISNSAT